jgi:hypothetical protein
MVFGGWLYQTHMQVFAMALLYLNYEERPIYLSDKRGTVTKLLQSTVLPQAKHGMYNSVY